MSDGDPIYLKAVLRPNPPLPRRALYGLVAVVAALNLFFALFFVLRGAWPVSPFMGADVLFLAWAFASSNKAARHREEVLLTSSALRVDIYPAGGQPTRADLNPYWVRVRLEEPVQGRSAIELASHGRCLRIGAFLAPSHRVAFANALRGALARTRDYPTPRTSIIE